MLGQMYANKSCSLHRDVSTTHHQHVIKPQYHTQILTQHIEFLRINDNIAQIRVAGLTRNISSVVSPVHLDGDVTLSYLPSIRRVGDL